MFGRFVLVAALASASAWAQSPAQSPPGAAPAAAEQPAPIVVTGRRLSDTERALAECLARKCPPDQDIDATLAHAENLFVAGKYQDARATAKASLGRNRRHAAKYPVPVSDLERSNGRLSAHLGEGYDYQYSTFGIRRALKQGLPGSDPRLVGANIEIADMLVSTGRPELARQTYATAEKDALKIGRRDLAATARMRSAWIDHLQDDKYNARRKLRLIAASTDPMERVPRLAAKLLLARLDRDEGKTDASDALIREVASLNLKQPVLLFSPPFDLTAQNNGVTSSVALQTSTDTFDDKWVDVGFWVRPDGRVEDIDILRKSGPTAWSAPLLKSIGGRIYSTSAADGGGAYRVERYSYTAFYGNRTGTRIRQRGSNARVEFLDLTVNPDAGAKAKPAADSTPSS